jgi:uncharacterized peroxidase-related enzyme
MSLFPSLPETPHLRDVFTAFPENVRPILEYHDMLLRGESQFSVGERELIAGFVSGLNACTFCFGSHKIIASKFGIDDGLIDALVADIDTAPVDEKLKPVLHYVAKLTRLPAQLTKADAQAVYDAGWSERALYDAVQVCAIFNFMNRIIEGTGVTFDYVENADAAEELRSRENHSYAGFGRSMGIEA